MKIGYDAKRAFNNFSGLGNYSRTLIRQMKKYFSKNEYFLYTTRHPETDSNSLISDTSLRVPNSITGKTIPSLWRTYGINKDILKDKIDIYHGLSNELPIGIRKTGAKSVVTIHDLIFMRFPDLYKPIDRMIYQKKMEYSVKAADHIIAISEQTRNDLLSYTKADPTKISVVYQSCNAIFQNIANEKDKTIIRQKYNLPKKFLIYVGTIEKRKNLLSVLKALYEGSLEIPLIVIGKETPYAQIIQHYIREKGIKNIHFLKNIPNEDLPVLYQMAEIFIYPSEFEGFGIPVLEAITSGVPVIAGKGSCLEETGGEGSWYVNPEDINTLSLMIRELHNDPAKRSNMIEMGIKHSKNFNDEKISSQLNSIYARLL